MLRTTNILKKFQLHAADGLIGSVKDFYFDDEKWTIRYIIVHTGPWLLGRDVLISPIAVRGISSDEKSILVELTKEKIENSPTIDTAEPISRRHEREYFQYYGWPYYWGGPAAWGWSGIPAPMPFGELPPRDMTPEDSEASDVHLRSAQEIVGYHIQARDAELGHVEDFVIQDATWALSDLLVDTRNWWPGKKVLVPHDAIQTVSWIDRTISVALSPDQIQEAPEYNAEKGLTVDYHRRVKEYYERQLTLK